MYPQILQDAVITVIGKDLGVEHKVRVVDITDSTVVITPVVDQNGYPIYLPTGARVRLGYVQKGYFYLETEVLDNVQERLPVVVLNKPDSTAIIREQRRENFRVPVTIRATITGQEGAEFPLHLIDLSAGGFLAISPKRILAKDDVILGELTLDLRQQVRTVSFQGIVTREVPDGRDYLYGVEFQDLHAQADIIIRYCMERQRRFLRTKTRVTIE